MNTDVGTRRFLRLVFPHGAFVAHHRNDDLSPVVVPLVATPRPTRRCNSDRAAFNWDCYATA